MKKILFLMSISIAIFTGAILSGCVHTVTKGVPEQSMLPAAPMLPTIPP
jgi:hypothetical protein